MRDRHGETQDKESDFHLGDESMILMALSFCRTACVSLVEGCAFLGTTKEAFVMLQLLKMDISCILCPDSGKCLV